MRFLRRGAVYLIWAEWIQTYVSRAFSKRMHTASFSGTLHAERIWNGDMLTDTIPCVCERCNSGWMSRLQTRAKPHIVPFLQATWPTLDRWASRSLAAWITMFTMVYEFRAPRTAAIPSKQRDTFRRTRDPIDGWEIRIAKINPNRWRGRITHVAGTLYDLKHSPLNARPDHQITTGVIGNLLFHSYYFAPELDMSMPEIQEYGSALGLTRIWPTAETPPHCPVRVLFDADAENVAYSLINVLAKVYGIQPLVPVRN